MNQLQKMEKQHEWLIGLNNRLIDMNERLIEQRGQDQKERELLLTLMNGIGRLESSPLEDEEPKNKRNGYSLSHLVSGKDFKPSTPPPILSELFMMSRPVSAIPEQQVTQSPPLIVKRKLVSGADFRPNQSPPKLSGLFL